MSKAQAIVLSVVLEGLSQAETARLYGVSQGWVSKLVARYRAEDSAAFEPRSRRPRTSPAKIPDPVVELAVNLRAELAAQGLDAGPHTICWHLQKRHRITVSPSSVRRRLTDLGLVEPNPKKRPKSSYVRFAADLPNEIWQSDFTHWRLAGGSDSEIITWLDDHSRFALSVSAHQRITGPIAADTFCETADQHGFPASVLTDNAMACTTRFSGGKGGRNALEALLADHEIQQKNSAPNRPTTCGKVERFQQTLKKWLRARTPADDLDQLQGYIDEFTRTYNHHRPHRSLDRTTPAAAYTRLPKTSPRDHGDGTHALVRWSSGRLLVLVGVGGGCSGRVPWGLQMREDQRRCSGPKRPVGRFFGLRPVGAGWWGVCDRSRPAGCCMMAGVSAAFRHRRAAAGCGRAGDVGAGMRAGSGVCFSYRLWYISHMGSVEVLGGLGPVFSTREFERAAGVRPSSASRALGELAVGGSVERIRRGTWRNFSVAWPSASDLLVGSGPVSHHWTPEWEAELEAAYGGTVRRISGLTALGMAGAALICRPEVTVEASVAFDTAPFGFASWRENRESLLVGAVQLTEHTWVSTPARAVLECAHWPHRSHRWEEYVGRMLAYRFEVCSPGEVSDTAGDLGWRAGLRRISSLAQGLAESPTGQSLGFDVDDRWAELGGAALRGDDWIHLAPLHRTASPPRIAYRDAARKVGWAATPDALAAAVST